MSHDPRVDNGTFPSAQTWLRWDYPVRRVGFTWYSRAGKPPTAEVVILLDDGEDETEINCQVKTRLTAEQWELIHRVAPTNVWQDLETDPAREEQVRAHISAIIDDLAPGAEQLKNRILEALDNA